MAAPAAKPSRSRVQLSGPFFDPQQAEKFKAHLRKALEPATQQLFAAIRARAPVKTGKLRDSIDLRIAMPKGKRARKITITAEGKATRPPTPGDPPRRYGRVPYGVFVDHRTGFLKKTFEDHYDEVFAAAQGGAKDWIRIMNGAPTTGAAPAPAPTTPTPGGA